MYRDNMSNHENERQHGQEGEQPSQDVTDQAILVKGKEVATALADAEEEPMSPELTADRLRDLSTLETTIQADFGVLLERLNTDLDFALAPRPEGNHVTIIGPTESDVLKSLTPDQLAELQRINSAISHGEGVTAMGIGIIDKTRVSDLRKGDQDKVALFVAFDIPALQEFRRSIGLPPKDFHVTLGFMGGDIHFKVTGMREDQKKPGKMVEITEPISKKADPALAHYELPAMTFGALSGKEKQKAPEKPSKETAPPKEKEATLITPQALGELNQFLSGLRIPNAREVFGILKSLKPDQDVRTALVGKVEEAVVDKIVIKIQE